MSHQVQAVFENGVLKPLEPLDLRDHEVVSLSIERCETRADRPVEGGSTLFEVFDRAGLVGCVKDAPPDLSSNPRYLEGLGRDGK